MGGGTNSTSVSELIPNGLAEGAQDQHRLPKCITRAASFHSVQEHSKALAEISLLLTFSMEEPYNF